MANREIEKIPFVKERFYTLLKSKGMSFRQYMLTNGEYLDRTEKTIRRWLEEGEAPKAVVKKIARTLGVDIWYFNGDEQKGLMLEDKASKSEVSARVAANRARCFMDFFHNSNYNHIAFANQIAEAGPSSQRSVMYIFIATAREIAKLSPTDGRQEETIELAKEIIEVANRYFIPRF
jgi:hypothetical protein